MLFLAKLQLTQLKQCSYQQTVEIYIHELDGSVMQKCAYKHLHRSEDSTGTPREMGQNHLVFANTLAHPKTVALNCIVYLED